MSAKILVVEDEPQHVTMLKAVLRGYEVLAAHNGETALELLTHHDIKLIITDLLMPQMNGVAFSQAARKLPKHYHTPIIAMSATTDANLIAGMKALGCFSILPKPVNIARLRTAVRDALSSNLI